MIAVANQQHESKFLHFHEQKFKGAIRKWSQEKKSCIALNYLDADDVGGHPLDKGLFFLSLLRVLGPGPNPDPGVYAAALLLGEPAGVHGEGGALSEILVEVLQVAREDDDVRPDGDLPVRLQLLVVDGQKVLVGREQRVEGALERCNFDSFKVCGKGKFNPPN